MHGHDDAQDDPTSIDAASNVSPKVVAILVDNHREFLKFLERRVGSRAVAEDILQEAFARGLDRLQSLRDDESAVAWFYRILNDTYARPCHESVLVRADCS